MRVKLENEHSIQEGWVATIISIDEVIVGDYQESYGHTINTIPKNFRTKEEVLEFLEKYYEESGERPNPDHEAYEKALREAIISNFVEANPELLLVVENSYERESSRGFCNTAYLRKAENEKDQSKHGWEKAQKLSEMDQNFWWEEIMDFLKNYDNGFCIDSYMPF